jgi:hypothetical protein
MASTLYIAGETVKTGSPVETRFIYLQKDYLPTLTTDDDKEKAEILYKKLFSTKTPAPFTSCDEYDHNLLLTGLKTRIQTLSDKAKKSLSKNGKNSVALRQKLGIVEDLKGLEKSYMAQIAALSCKTGGVTQEPMAVAGPQGPVATGFPQGLVATGFPQGFVTAPRTPMSNAEIEEMVKRFAMLILHIQKPTEQSKIYNAPARNVFAKLDTFTSLPGIVQETYLTRFKAAGGILNPLLERMLGVGSAVDETAITEKVYLEVYQKIIELVEETFKTMPSVISVIKDGLPADKKDAVTVLLKRILLGFSVAREEVDKQSAHANEIQKLLDEARAQLLKLEPELAAGRNAVKKVDVLEREKQALLDEKKGIEIDLETTRALYEGEKRALVVKDASDKELIEGVRAEVMRLETQLAECNAARDQSNALVERLQGEMGLLNMKMVGFQTESTNKQKEIEKLTRTLDEKVGELADTEKRRAALLARVSELDAKIATLTAGSDSAAQSASVASGELAKITMERDMARNDLREAATTIVDREREIERLGEEMDAARTLLQTESADLEAAKVALARAVADRNHLTDEKEKSEVELRAAATLADRLRTELALSQGVVASRDTEISGLIAKLEATTEKAGADAAKQIDASRKASDSALADLKARLAVLGGEKDKTVANYQEQLRKAQGDFEAQIAHLQEVKKGELASALEAGRKARDGEIAALRLEKDSKDGAIGSLEERLTAAEKRYQELIKSSAAEKLHDVSEAVQKVRDESDVKLKSIAKNLEDAMKKIAFITSQKEAEIKAMTEEQEAAKEELKAEFAVEIQKIKAQKDASCAARILAEKDADAIRIREEVRKEKDAAVGVVEQGHVAKLLALQKDYALKIAAAEKACEEKVVTVRGDLEKTSAAQKQADVAAADERVRLAQERVAEVEGKLAAQKPIVGKFVPKTSEELSAAAAANIDRLMDLAASSSQGKAVREAADLSAKAAAAKEAEATALAAATATALAVKEAAAAGAQKTKRISKTPEEIKADAAAEMERLMVAAATSAQGLAVRQAAEKKKIFDEIKITLQQDPRTTEHLNSLYHVLCDDTQAAKDALLQILIDDIPTAQRDSNLLRAVVDKISNLSGSVEYLTTSGIGRTEKEEIQNIMARLGTHAKDGFSLVLQPGASDKWRKAPEPGCKTVIDSDWRTGRKIVSEVCDTKPAVTLDAGPALQRQKEIAAASAAAIAILQKSAATASSASAAAPLPVVPDTLDTAHTKLEKAGILAARMAVKPDWNPSTKIQATSLQCSAQEIQNCRSVYSNRMRKPMTKTIKNYCEGCFRGIGDTITADNFLKVAYPSVQGGGRKTKSKKRVDTSSKKHRKTQKKRR